MSSVTTIRTSCPECGEVDLPAEQVFLVIDDADTGSYSFFCPLCKDQIDKRADAKIINLLLATEEVQIAGYDQDWDEAFVHELDVCQPTKHRWDFPVYLGQRCMCGEEEWIQ